MLHGIDHGRRRFLGAAMAAVAGRDLVLNAVTNVRSGAGRPADGRVDECSREVRRYTRDLRCRALLVASS